MQVSIHFNRAAAQGWNQSRNGKRDGDSQVHYLFGSQLVDPNIATVSSCDSKLSFVTMCYGN